VDAGFKEVGRVVGHAKPDLASFDRDDVRRRHADVWCTHGNASLELESRVINKVTTWKQHDGLTPEQPESDLSGKNAEYRGGPACTHEKDVRMMR
jgi:hypothetical protein